LKIPAIGSPVLVSWNDSVDSPGWQYVMPGEKLDVSLRPAMQTRGVLIAVDVDSLAVASTIAPRGPNDLKEGYLGVLTIPRGCLVGVKVIE